MHAALLDIELHLGDCQSLKAKRAVVRPLVEGLRTRLRVSVSEAGHLDRWQRTRIGVAIVGGTVEQCQTQLDAAERFVWARPDVEVVSMTVHWIEPDG